MTDLSVVLCIMCPQAGFTITQVDRAHLHPMFQKAGCPTRLLALHRHPAGGPAAYDGGGGEEAVGGVEAALGGES